MGCHVLEIFAAFGAQPLSYTILVALFHQEFPEGFKLLDLFLLCRRVLALVVLVRKLLDPFCYYFARLEIFSSTKGQLRIAQGR